MDFEHFSWLSFDCYGTLIDWESGILNALRPLLQSHGVAVSDGDLLQRYARLESAQERSEFRRYREVLRGVVRDLAGELNFTLQPGEENTLAESLGTWQPFPDTVGALKQLKTHCKLAVISNVDDDLFAQTAKLLQVEFDEVITAQQVGSYKPSHRNFEVARQRFGVPINQWLHVAQSLYHDHVPARELGISSVWVNRRSTVPGGGATPPSELIPPLEVPDLQSLVGLMFTEEK